MAEALRDAVPTLRLIQHCGGGGVKNQMKKADKSGAQLALVLGDAELAAGTVGVKPLRDDTPQRTVARGAVAAAIKDYLDDRRQ